MKALLGIIGNVAAVAGVIVCLVAGGARLAGHYHVGHFEAMTLFMGGIGLMVFACLAKLQTLATGS
jgi:hypothetical protein